MTRVGVLALLVLVAASPTASATTMPSLIVGVNVALKPDAVTLSTRQVARGYYVRFKVRNTTSARRSFSMAGRTIAVPARKYRLLVIEFDVRGSYRYASRTASGTAIRGTFRVS